MTTIPIETTSPSQTHPRSHWAKNAWRLLVLPFVLFICVPLLALILRITPTELWLTLHHEPVQQAIRLSLITSLVTVLVTILFGTPVAYYISHPHYPYQRLLDTIIDLPIVLPPAVAGVALLMAFGRRGLLGSELAFFGLSIPFTPLAVILAQTFIAAPFYIKSAAMGFRSVDCELRRAAALDGASRWQSFRFLMVPMAGVALLNGCVLTWARALGEFGATIIFAGNFPGRTQTMPLAIYIGFEMDLNMALTLSVILVLISFLILLLVKGILHNRVDGNLAETYD